MTKRAISAKKPRQKVAPTRKAKTALLRSAKDDVKRAAVKRKVHSSATISRLPPRETRVPPREPKTAPEAPTPETPVAFNPFVALIDSQVQMAGAMLRWSPFGLFLRSKDAALVSKRKQALP